MAFIALNADAARRAEKDPREGDRIKAALIKVRLAQASSCGR
jgi:hypothetical protein